MRFRLDLESRSASGRARVVIAAAAAVWCAVAVISGLGLWREHQAELDHMRQSSTALVSLIQEHATRTFQSTDLVLGGIAVTMSLTPLARHDPGFRAAMRARLEDIPYVRALFVIDPRGYIVHDTDHPDTPDVSLANREYFKRYIDDPTLMHDVSVPLQSRSGKGWFIPVTRRVVRDGRFEGVAVAALKPQYFESVYEGIGLDAGQAVALYHARGQLVSAHPRRTAAVVGIVEAGNEIFATRVDEVARDTFFADEGSYLRTPDFPDGSRVVSYAALPSYPMVVAMSESTASALAAWRRLAWATAWALVLLALALGALVAQYLRHEKAEQRARERLARAEKMEALGRLTGTVAHDFGNLMGVVSNSLHSLATRTAGDAQLEASIKVARRAVERGATLVRQMLAFAKPQPEQAYEVDLNDVVRSSEGLLRQAAGAARLVVELDEHLKPCVADESQFEVCLLNLVVNARDAMQGRDGTITIQTCDCTASQVVERGLVTTERFACVTVRDDGPGMPPDVMSRLFEPFFTTKGDAGTGLGLAQVYGFMHQVGGDVRVESELGRGTAFHLFFRPVGR